MLCECKCMKTNLQVNQLSCIVLKAVFYLRPAGILEFKKECMHIPDRVTHVT